MLAPADVVTVCNNTLPMLAVPVSVSVPFRFRLEVAEPGLAPMFILVIEAVEPPVPIFSVFLVVVPVPPVAKLYVEAPVDAVNIFTV